AFGIKTDYNLTPSRRVSFRYTWDDLDWQFPNWFHNVADVEGRPVFVPRHSGVLSYTDSLSPTLLLDAKAGFNREFENYATPSSGFDVTKLNMPAALSDYIRGRGASGVFPLFNITDATNFGGREAQ